MFSGAVKEQLNEASSIWEGLYRAKRFKELSELYTEDCKVYPPGRPIAIGRAGMYRQMLLVINHVAFILRLAVIIVS